MPGSIRTSPITHIVVDPLNNAAGAAVVNAEPSAENGVVVWPAVGYVDNPIRTDPTGTTVQPVSIVAVGAANLATNQVSVGNTATLIVPANPTRRCVTITNAGLVDVFIGNSSSVTISTGDLLAGVKGAFVTLPTTSAVYGIVGIGSPPTPNQTVTYAEIYD